MQSLFQNITANKPFENRPGLRHGFLKGLHFYNLFAAVTTANSSFVIRQFFRRAEIGQEVVQKGFHSAMGWRLGGDEAGGISPFAKRFQKFIVAADDMQGDRPWLVFSGDLNIGLMVAQDDNQGVMV